MGQLALEDGHELYEMPIVLFAEGKPEGQKFDLTQIDLDDMVRRGWVDHAAKVSVQAGIAVHGEAAESAVQRIYTEFQAGRLPAVERSTEELKDDRERAARAEAEVERLTEVNRMKEETHARELEEMQDRLLHAQEEDLDLLSDAERQQYQQAAGVINAARKEQERRAAQKAQAQAGDAPESTTGQGAEGK